MARLARRISTILLLLFLAGCHNFSKDSKTLHSLFLDAPEEAKVSVYSVAMKGDKPEYYFVGNVEGQKAIELSPGYYVVANDCSAYQVKVSEPKTDVKMSSFKLKYMTPQSALSLPTSFTTQLTCYNKVTKHKKSFSTISNIYLLPGDNILSVVGKPYKVKVPTDTSKNFFIPVFPLTLYSVKPSDNSLFFIEYQNSKKSRSSKLVTHPLNETLWLPKGDYNIEINGTEQGVTIEENQMHTLNLGSVRILAPQHFYEADKLKLIHSPIFAYLNNQTLLKLDHIYSVFPGEYRINLGHSKVEKHVSVEAGSLVNLQTYGAQIDPPDCTPSEKEKCHFTEKVSIHTQGNSEPLLEANLGEPFVVFDENYYYSIEGTDGVLKHLKKSPISIVREQVGEIQFEWKLNISTHKFETRKIEIEAVCCNIMGKSKDINSYKPRKLLLPAGEYRLTSSIRQDQGLLTRRTKYAKIASTKPSEVEIPIYAQSDQNLNLLFQNEEETSEGPSTLIPIAQ